MIERRRYPRISLELPAIVELTNKESLLVELRDISSEGLRFVCDKSDKELIAPNSQWDPAEIVILIDFPNATENSKFEASGTVVSLRRISSTRFFVSVQFSNCTEKNHNNLGSLINMRMAEA